MAAIPMTGLRIRFESERRGFLIRFMSDRWAEFAYILFGLRGLKAEIEFPSDWHDRPAGWVRLGFGLVTIGFSFSWSKVVPDDFQCSGPTYGFSFFGDGLHVHWGKTHGRRDDPFTIIDMPWAWRNCKHEVITKVPKEYSYHYELHSGEIQERVATVKVETWQWTRPWLPWRRTSKAIDVSFDKEVGERSGSWKGGVTGCGYKMLPGEHMRDTLRRMERERRFT